MFDTLIESRPNPLGLSRWGLVCALGVHAVAISAALRTPRAGEDTTPIVVDEFPAAPAPVEHHEPRPEPGPILRGIDGLPLVLPPTAPIPGLSDLTRIPRIDFGDTHGQPLAPIESAAGPLPDSLVQDRPLLLAGPPPEYPRRLRDAGVEGVVVIEVVVDTLGRPERGSARIVQHAAPEFETSAAAAILAARFRPARVWGRAVRVLIRIPVAFRLHR